MPQLDSVMMGELVSPNPLNPFRSPEPPPQRPTPAEAKVTSQSAPADLSGREYRLDLLDKASVQIVAHPETGAVLLVLIPTRGPATSVALSEDESSLVGFHVMAARRYIQTHRSLPR